MKNGKYFWMNLGNILFLYKGCDQPVDGQPWDYEQYVLLQRQEASSSRISNAKESDIHFPWVVRVERTFTGDTYTFNGRCSGTIINDRYYQLISVEVLQVIFRDIYHIYMYIKYPTFA